MVMTTKDKTQYKNDWQRENKASIRLVVNKEIDKEIRQAAKDAGLSLNAYILSAVKEKMNGGKTMDGN